MNKNYYGDDFYLVRTNRGEYISGENAVFLNLIRSKIYREAAHRHGLPLEIHKLADGQRWCLKQEYNAVEKALSMEHTMNILDRLKEMTKNANIRFPKDIEIRQGYKEFIIKLSGDGITANMQTDASAFESWAICLKTYLCEADEGVCIEWEKPHIDEKNEAVYHRFLYRAIKFTECFDWARISSSVNDDIESIRQKLENEKIIINYSNKKEHIVEPSNYSTEHNLELGIVLKMRETYGDCIDHQLPVGLFVGSVCKENMLATGGKSQIDIWRLHDNALYIYELKKTSNIALGIITELLFYANVMKDLMEGKISYPEDFCNAGRSIDKLHDAIAMRAIDNVNAVFLANNLHPLIGEKVMDLLNTNSRGIRFSHERCDSYIVERCE